MSYERLIPGYGNVQESGTRQVLSPGSLYVNETVSTGSIFTISPSGSITFSGSITQIHEKIVVPAGSISFSGSAGITFIPSGTIYTIVPTGSVVFSGTCPQIKERSFIPVGNIEFSGSTIFIYEHVISSTGDISFSGTNQSIKIRLIIPTGYIIFSGTAPIYTPSSTPDISTQLTMTFAGHA